MKAFPCVVATLDSRDASTFSSEVMKVTKGNGVDVVLNSLSGDALIESVRCLTPGGQFCEIGKVDILKNSNLGLALLKNNITFHSCHLDLLADTNPALIHSLLEECTLKLASNELTLIDTEVVPFTSAPEIFRKMAQGQHQGKIVFQVDRSTLTPKAGPPSAPSSSNQSAISSGLFRAHGSYVITGGTSGVGLALAQWAMENGAQHLVLIGSGQRTRKLTALAIDSLKATNSDATVTLLGLDLTNPTSVKSALATVTPPIRGIFHLATAYTAQTADKVTPEQFAEVTPPFTSP